MKIIIVISQLKPNINDELRSLPKKHHPTEPRYDPSHKFIDRYITRKCSWKTKLVIIITIYDPYDIMILLINSPTDI